MGVGPEKMTLDIQKRSTDFTNRSQSPFRVVHAAVSAANEMAEALRIKFANAILQLRAQDVIEKLAHLVLIAVHPR